MIFYEQALEYWTIAKRFHEHRDQPIMPGVACRDMTKVLESTTSKAVARRVTSFLDRYKPRPPQQFA